MAIQIESDLKDILLKIDNKLDNLQTDMTEVKISIVELKKDNQRLEEKIDNTDKKIDASAKNLEDKIDNIAKSLEDKIDNTDKKIDTTAKSLEDKIDNTDKKIDATAKNLEDKINAIDKNLTDNIQNLAKRVDNSEFINRGIFIGLIVTLLGGFAKFLGIIGN